MKNIIFMVLFFYHTFFGLKDEDDNLLQIDEDMITVIADKIITERMEMIVYINNCRSLLSRKSTVLPYDIRVSF
jgi:hypothetical protein